MKNKILFILVLFFVLSSLAFGEPTAQKYFNEATTQYLVGNLKVALKNINLALEQEPKHAGALKLKKSILREMGLKEPAPTAPKPAVVKPIEAPPTVSREAAPVVSHEVVTVGNSRTIWTIFGLGLVGLILIVFLVWRFNSDLLVRFAPAKPEVEEKEPAVLRSISDDQKRWYKKMSWRSNPFTLDIKPKLFTGFEKEIKEILEKINARSGHVLIYGPLGVGKTTMMRWLAEQLPRQDYLTVYIARPPIVFDQLVKHIFDSMGVSEKGVLKELDLYTLNKLRAKMKRQLVLLLDEAHELTVEIERPLRTLGDIDGINLIMAGLPETVEKLKNEIQPLYERLVLKVPIDHMDLATLKELVMVRIKDAGGIGIHPFTTAALEKVSLVSGGIPRKAIKLCDRAVSAAINQGVENIDAALIKEDSQID